MSMQHLITATPPTPNGDLHLGHLSGPYLRADIYTRYLKMCGREAYYLSGADDHQTYVPFKAGTTELAAATAERFTSEIKQTLQLANIHPDIFTTPRRSRYHIPYVQEFFLKLYAEGKIIVKEQAFLFCEHCHMQVFEAYVRGLCPHCNTASGGNACEMCGRPNDCIDLQESVCSRCGHTPVERSAPRLYFPLGVYEAELREFYTRVEMNAHMQALCQQMLASGLPDIAVSHFSDWGIPVPISGFEGQSIYVWFEMAPGYLAETQELCDKQGLEKGWQTFWYNPGGKRVQFFGFDNGYFHAVLFPALFRAYDPKIQLATAFVTNEFYLLDGQKFSTSRGHAIWGKDMLRSISSDMMRFYLAYSGPEAEQTNFTLEDFLVTVQRELTGNWQEWLQALGERVTQECSGVVATAEAWTEEQHQFRTDLKKYSRQIVAAYEAKGFSPQSATRILCELVRTTRAFSQQHSHLAQITSYREYRSTDLALELLAAKTLALLAFPIMPTFAEQLWQNLGFAHAIEDAGWEALADWMPSAQKVGPIASSYFAPVSRDLNSFFKRHAIEETSIRKATEYESRGV